MASVVQDHYFSDIFSVSENDLEEYGAFNISLITDLPLFVDPFLLFASAKPEYQKLHDRMIDYLRFLRDQSLAGLSDRALIAAWYRFSEVRQNWLGFSAAGNSGRGLGAQFAVALNNNLVTVFQSFGNERITRGSHLEKLCLIRGGVGRDMISDFTTNLIKDYLLQYTQTFADVTMAANDLKRFAVERVSFNHRVKRWLPRTFTLPHFRGDYVLLTPKDILTKDDTWISHRDMLNRFRDIPAAIPDAQLRAQINEYFRSVLPRTKEPNKTDLDNAIMSTILSYPQLVDYYIRDREDSGEEAIENSANRVFESNQLYVQQFRELSALLACHTRFYDIPENTSSETRDKILFFKDIIENKGGWRLFYIDNQPIRKEADVHIMFRLVWHKTPSDVSREVDDGRGPADFKISRGAHDKTIVEFKLAKNSQLERNLWKQVKIYKSASDASTGFKVILYFTEEELTRVTGILVDLKIGRDPHVILIDARADNKPSGSKA